MIMRMFKKLRVRTALENRRVARSYGCLCGTPYTASRRRRTARVATAGGGVNTAVGGRPRPRRRTAVTGAAPTPTSRKRRVGYQDRCNRRPQPPPQRPPGATRVGPWYRLVLVYKIPRFRWTARPLLFTRRACFLLPAKRARERAVLRTAVSFFRTRHPTTCAGLEG